jgi:hypothetical protein
VRDIFRSVTKKYAGFVSYSAKEKSPRNAGIFLGHYRRFFAAFFVAFFAVLRFFAAIYDVKIYFS